MNPPRSAPPRARRAAPKAARGVSGLACRTSRVARASRVDPGGTGRRGAGRGRGIGRAIGRGARRMVPASSPRAALPRTADGAEWYALRNSSRPPHDKEDTQPVGRMTPELLILGFLERFPVDICTRGLLAHNVTPVRGKRDVNPSARLSNGGSQSWPKQGEAPHDAARDRTRDLPRHPSRADAGRGAQRPRRPLRRGRPKPPSRSCPCSASC